VAFSRPSIFIAGNYVADESLGPRLAVFPHWLHVEVIVEGRQLSLQAGRVLEHRRLLDLRQGVHGEVGLWSYHTAFLETHGQRCRSASLRTFAAQESASLFDLRQSSTRVAWVNS
jgi:trehalose/maltose hydrolase-like predicted phosphorylase